MAPNVVEHWMLQIPSHHRLVNPALAEIYFFYYMCEFKDKYSSSAYYFKTTKHDKWIKFSWIHWRFVVNMRNWHVFFPFLLAHSRCITTEPYKYRTYNTAARRYEFYFRVVNNVLRMSKILSSLQGDNIHIFKLLCVIFCGVF